MKKGICLLVVIWLAGVAWGAEVPGSAQNMSIKAGPTESGEKISMAWVEAYVSPKEVKGEGTITLGVRTTAKVKTVKAAFDFCSDSISLSSPDGMAWSGSFPIPEKTMSGAHVARFQIANERGSIQRTVEFSVIEIQGKAAVEEDNVLEESRWPLTVTSTCAALSGNAVRILKAGQTVTGMSKIPWYKVAFSDGTEGWVPATQVKDPTEDYYQAGYAAYKLKNYPEAVKNYKQTVAVSPAFVKGYVWLAKSYMAQGDLDRASVAVQKALRMDSRDMDARMVANVLAQKFFLTAQKEFSSKRYNGAIAAYRKVVEVKPNSVLSWKGIGESYRLLGMDAEARNAWREALKYEPENQELHALLGTGYSGSAAPAGNALVLEAAGKETVAPLLADDSIAIVRGEKTHKGTKIESAIRSVVTLTKSLGTGVQEKGWSVQKKGDKLVASYVCEQKGGVIESFDWQVDVDTHRVLPSNDNARILMSRW